MHRNIILTKLNKYCKENNIDDKDIGFLRFVNEVFYNGNESEINNSIVDGQSDKQIDLIQIEDDEVVTIRIMQVKNTKGFESNVLILLNNGLDWIFNRDEEELQTLKNASFKDRILEVRDVMANNNMKNVYIDVIYITLGKKSDIAKDDEIVAEINNLQRKYKALFENFRFELYGAKELLEYVDLQNDKSVNASLELIYDANVASLIENKYDNIKSLVCDVKASELVKIFLEQKSEYLFEQNVRKYLEDRSKVNKNIIETAGNSDSKYFWALNNGVTIICDEYKINRLGGKATLIMQNLQIINGCQTTMALFQANKNNNLNEDTSLLLRIHETKDENIIEKIILSTNNQNPINPKDLISNSIYQIDLQRYFFEVYGVFYQRKRNDFRDINGKLVNKKEIVSNDKVGQAALACIKCMPYAALASKGRIYSSDIDIFEKNKEWIALAFFIHEKVLEYAKCNYIKNNSEILSIIKFGRFHLTYLIFKQYISKISINLNKEIKHGDIDLSDDIFLGAYILNENLATEKKLNLLSYFKSKDSLNKINKVLEIIKKINNTIERIISIYSINNFNIIEFYERDMIFEIDNVEIKINIDGSVSIYRRFLYNDCEYNEDRNKELQQEENEFIDALKDEFNIFPKRIDDSYIDCPETDILVGYFDRKFDKKFIEKFVEF